MFTANGIVASSSFSLKAFRAGPATQLAVDGAGWQTALAAGEWRGLSALKYIDADLVDESAFIRALFEASSDEELS